jgi:hypothetical protein
MSFARLSVVIAVQFAQFGVKMDPDPRSRPSRSNLDRRLPSTISAPGGAPTRGTLGGSPEQTE